MTGPPLQVPGDAGAHATDSVADATADGVSQVIRPSVQHIAAAVPERH